VVLHHRVEDRGLPLLIIGNHVSSWDGFIAQYVNLELFHRKIHIMMLEEQLKKRMFFNKTGAYSIKKGGRSALESIRYTAEILADPGNLAVLFPQGSIHSLYERPVRFERGWHRIFGSLRDPVQMVMLVSLFDFFSDRRPQLHLYLHDYPYEGKSVEQMERDFNEFLDRSIDHQKQLV